MKIISTQAFLDIAKKAEGVRQWDAMDEEADRVDMALRRKKEMELGPREKPAVRRQSRPSYYTLTPLDEIITDSEVNKQNDLDTKWNQIMEKMRSVSV